MAINKGLQFDANQVGLDRETIAQRAQVPVITADSLTQPQKQVKLPQPKLSTPPSQFVNTLQPAINQAQQGLIQAQTEEANQRNDVLRQLLRVDDPNSQDTYDNKFRQLGGNDYLKQFTDANTRLAQLQGVFNTGSQKVSSAPGQSQVFEGLQLNEVSRQKAVEVGNQALVVQALQGNVETARQIALDTTRFASEDRANKLQSLMAQFQSLDGIVQGQEKQLIDAQKVKIEQEYDQLKRTQNTIDTAIQSGGASTEEMIQLSNPNLSDEQKMTIAQGILARTSFENRTFEQGQQMFENNIMTQELQMKLQENQGEPDKLLSAEELIKFGGLPAGTTWGDVTAAGIAPEKPATESELKAASFATRIEQSINTLNGVESYINGLGTIAFKIGLKAPNFLKDAEMQQYQQAERDFINAQLRRESGAVISDEEFANARQQYFPQPGDKPETLAQKKVARETALNNIRAEAGNAYTGNRPSLFDIEAGNQVKGTKDSLQKIPLLNMDGSEKTPNIPLTKAYPQGSTGGQCGVWVRNIVEKQGLTYPRVGDTLSAKMATARKYGVPLSQARTGSVILTNESKDTGHVAYVIGKNAKGFVLGESNYGLNGKVSYGRILPYNSSKIVGVINPSRA